MQELRIVGAMSGTSLDGLDLVCVDFFFTTKIEYNIVATTCIDYSVAWKKRLTESITLSAIDLKELDNDFALFTAIQINDFKKNYALENINYIASHGHTVYHQPSKKISLQIGSGAVIAANTGIETICDFRSTDIALGGQGAPLVPIGDQILFANYDVCFNIGGFANISYHDKIKNSRIAFDVCAVNIILNRLANFFDKPFDYNGELARQGNVNNDLLNELNAISFYSQKPPKSLGIEWSNEFVWPLLGKNITQDTITTYTHHIAIQICASIPKAEKTCIFTGGGALNIYLMELVKKHIPNHIIAIPSNETINFKEALIFALLGYLRVNKLQNSLSSVTGALKNACGGAIYTV